MTAHAAELADPTYLDDRLSHWAEANPDGEAFTYLGPHVDVGPVERSRTPAGGGAEVAWGSAVGTSCRSSTRTIPRASS